MSHSHPHPHQHGPPPGQQMQLPPPGMGPTVPDDLIHQYSIAVDKAHNVTSTEVDGDELTALNGLIKALMTVNDNPQQLPQGIPQQFIMTEYIPPPPQPIPNMRSNHIAKAKEDGNIAFRGQKYADAIRLYSISASLAASRPVFESHQYSRDELSLALCNRSAAYAADGKFVEALVDANAVLTLKKQFTKGYFRKAKALSGLGWYAEAKEALLLGLEFEPANEDLSTALEEVDKNIKQQSEKPKTVTAEITATEKTEAIAA